jgi:hypothetical protein
MTKLRVIVAFRHCASAPKTAGPEEMSYALFNSSKMLISLKKHGYIRGHFS